MTDTTKVREHYSGMGLIARIKLTLATLAPEGQTLTVVQLAPLTINASKESDSLI